MSDDTEERLGIIMKKRKTNLGEKCATWNCNGKIIANDKVFKRQEAKCDKCGREYWIVERKDGDNQK
jgi:hypothetical protein